MRVPSIKTLLRQATIEVTCEMDDAPVRGNVLASGNADEDKAQEDYVLTQLADGNEWAWCHITVTARWEAPDGQEYVGQDSLGACSYASQRDFERSGEWDTMRDNALCELHGALLEVAREERSSRATKARPPTWVKVVKASRRT